MSTLIVYLLLWYGLAFGCQHKLPFLHERFDWLDKLLACSYCTGFHVGWTSYLIVHFPDVLGGHYNFLALPAELVTWGFAAAAWCYVADVGVQAVESYIAKK